MMTANPRLGRCKVTLGAPLEDVGRPRSANLSVSVSVLHCNDTFLHTLLSDTMNRCVLCAEEIKAFMSIRRSQTRVVSKICNDVRPRLPCGGQHVTATSSFFEPDSGRVTMQRREKFENFLAQTTSFSLPSLLSSALFWLAVPQFFLQNPILEPSASPQPHTTFPYTASTSAPLTTTHICRR